MAKTTYSVIWGPWRFYLPIGVKTLIAFLMVMTCLAGGIYYYTSVKLSGQIEREAMESLNSKLQGGWRIYHSRVDQMRYGLLQATSERYVVDAIVGRDVELLRELLDGYAYNRSYVDLWAVVDEEKRVIARRNERSGDLLEIGGIVGRALATGEVLQSTERVDRDVLSIEDPRLSARVERTGIMQIVVVPVSRGGEIKGAFVTGILLNGYEWLPNAIYEHFSTESAVFGSIFQETRIVSSANLPRSVFSPLLRMPADVSTRISQGEIYRGRAVIDGMDAFVSADPIINLAGEVIGGLTVAEYASVVNRIIRSIKREIYLYTAVGLFISMILAVFAYRDTAIPINAISAAMSDASRGNFDVRTRIETRDEFERMGAGFNLMMENIQVREERIDRFNELSKLLITALDPATLLDKALAMVVDLTDSHMGIIYLYDEKSDSLIPNASFGIGGEGLREIKMGEGLPGMCAIEKKAIVLQEIPDDSLLLDVGFAHVRPKGVAWFAMCYKDRLLGVFVIGSIHQYNEDEIKHLEYLVAQIAIALDNATTHKLIERLSITDSLTGLYNRRHLYERLGAALSEAKRYGHPLALVMIDIDDFKQINDTMGHQQGDRILVELGTILKEHTREHDLWARYGGEEFIGYLPHCDLSEARTMAEKIREIIAGHEFKGMKEKRATVSIGVASFPEAATLDDLVGAADDFLYKAKRGGKNRVMAG